MSRRPMHQHTSARESNGISTAHGDHRPVRQLPELRWQCVLAAVLYVAAFASRSMFLQFVISNQTALPAMAPAHETDTWLSSMLKSRLRNGGLSLIDWQPAAITAESSKLMFCMLIIGCTVASVTAVRPCLELRHISGVVWCFIAFSRIATFHRETALKIQRFSGRQNRDPTGGLLKIQNADHSLMMAMRLARWWQR
ncbi:hypothetical protein TNCT_296761 [Trichonephila clavata]|uniref:Uncharacterized protein n=1 Tax=Trichonephila clavata TaxID=2740835 RepID=A0A8X6I1A6_TRICU|nr:hypothetical protein TNCT_296761 [Trichonephila clavata]